mgnify:CR=1 FL=1
MTRCRLVANTRSRAGPMSRSGVVKPGTSALVESIMRQVDTLLTEAGEGAQVGDAGRPAAAGPS